MENYTGIVKAMESLYIGEIRVNIILYCEYRSIETEYSDGRKVLEMWLIAVVIAGIVFVLFMAAAAAVTVAGHYQTD